MLKKPQHMMTRSRKRTRAQFLESHATDATKSASAIPAEAEADCLKPKLLPTSATVTNKRIKRNNPSTKQTKATVAKQQQLKKANNFESTMTKEETTAATTSGK